MEYAGNIPLFGWIVILVALVLIFILAWFRGISFKKDGEISIEKKLSEYDDRKIHDEDVRLELYRKVEEIDNTEHSEEKRLIKNIRIKIRLIIKGNTSCDIAFRSVVDVLTEVIANRIIENNLRTHLSKDEKERYIHEILNEMEDNYTNFTAELSGALCRQINKETNLYPKFKELKNSFLELLNDWADDIIRIIIKSCKEKIKIYEDNIDTFINEKYKETSVLKPLEKNQKYIEQLGGVIL